MALVPNTTCEIYRQPNAPPAAPDVGLTPCQVTAQYSAGLEQGETLPNALRVSHIMNVSSTIDVRDDYNLGVVTIVNNFVWIPDRNGTKYAVVFVERHGKGTAHDYKTVYLQRQQPTWPTDNL